MAEAARALLLDDCRILVVEDEYFIATEIVAVLSAEGAIVLGPAGTIQRAQELIDREQRLDGALLDVNLGGEMVWPVLDALQFRRVPVVLTSGYDRSIIPERYRRVPCCEKPADGASVAQSLASAIAQGA